jgi:hypothetical protein
MHNLDYADLGVIQDTIKRIKQEEYFNSIQLIEYDVLKKIKYQKQIKTKNGSKTVFDRTSYRKAKKVMDEILENLTGVKTKKESNLVNLLKSMGAVEEDAEIKRISGQEYDEYINKITTEHVISSRVNTHRHRVRN